MSWHPTERRALVDALRDAGPNAPTLCEGWSTRHLAAHVVLRERDPLVSLGIVAPPLHGLAERRTRALGDRGADADGWPRLVARVADGPPPWHPLRWAGDAAQLAELFVHTEDVRRVDAGAAPRHAGPGQARALMTAVRRTAPLFGRGLPVRALLTAPDGTVVACGPTGAPEVRVHGAPGELLLWAFERSAVADVRLEGAEQDVDRLRRARPSA